MWTASLLLGLAPFSSDPAAGLASEVVLGPDPVASAAVSPGALQDGAMAALLPAETRFVAHFDLRAVLESRIWREAAQAQVQRELEGNEELQQLKNELGIDPFVDLHAVTLFGATPDEDSLTVLVRGTKALETALRRIEGMDGYTKYDVDGLGLHVFNQGGENTYLYSHEGARSDERLIVVSPSRTELLRSALVLRGERQSVATLRSTAAAPGLDLDAPAGTLFQLAFAGSIPGLDGDDPVSGLLRMARGGVFRIAERRGDLALHLGLLTENEDQALEMADAVDGLKALGNMLLKSADDVPPEARQLLRSFQVNNDEAKLFVDFEFPLERLFEMAESSGLDW